MKELGRFQFPETPEEAKTWAAYATYSALASSALAAAHTRIEGAWKAYCKGVPGISHAGEWRDVLTYGDALAEDVARVIFPEFKGVPYAR